MAENTKIQWAHHTFNPWRGCTKVAEGCANCYADALSKRNPSTLGIWGPNGTRVMAAPAAWREPLKWNKAAEAAGERHRVFCASLADVFEDWDGPIKFSTDEDACVCHGCGRYMRYTESCNCDSPKRDRLPRRVTMGDLRIRLFELIDATPHLDWLLVTKRPENIRRMWPVKTESVEPFGRELQVSHGARRNVWLLTSIAEQADADKNIPELLKCRDLAPVLGVSAEPLIGPVDLFADGLSDSECPRCIDQPPDYETNVVECRSCDSSGKSGESMLDWIIVGGESGHHARPFNIQWARSIIAQCKAESVPCFVKQLGAVPFEDDSQLTGAPVDRSKLTRLPGAAMKDTKGGDWNEWPADLRVREFPRVAAEVARAQ